MTITRTHGSAARHDAAANTHTSGAGPGTVSAAAVAAVASLLGEDCGMGQQLMFIAAIRRDTRIDLSDAEIKDLVCEAIEEGWTAETTLARLVALDAGSDGIRGVDCCPR
jgi:hypothetical protein